ncbi:hypothetical protein HY632_00880 [Candidatus Uhrbacteria bacterium]|nr:hypothetical protein [Candidatus Uhrbacteria bacterium]
MRVMLAGLVAVVMAGTSVLSWQNVRASDIAPRFHWPDETTNAYFAARIARGESFVVPEPRNRDVGNIIHPRTMNVRPDGALVPGSYLGLPLWYGLVGRATDPRVMGLLTPLLAGGALWALARLVARVAGAAVAAWAVVLVALHPSWWLFTATAFLPNVPFLSLLLMGGAVVVSRVRPFDRNGDEKHTSSGKELVRWGVGGLLVGIALTMRTHEALWVAGLLTLMVWWQRPSWYAVVAGMGGVLLPFLPILVLQQQLYGSPFTTGYALLQEGGALPTEFVRTAVPIPGILQALIAPFGWHPIAALSRAWHYLVQPYPWFALLACAGGVMVWPRHRRAVLGTLVMMAWLLLMYGSWELADPLVRATNMLTISYTRYWLPIIMLLAPWAAYGCVRIFGALAPYVRPYAGALLVGSIALMTMTKMVRDDAEGLLRQMTTLDDHRTRARTVLAATEPDAVVLSDRMDKVFFPERAVVQATPARGRDPVFRDHLRALIDRAPVYWYAPDGYASGSEWREMGFRTIAVSGGASGAEELYRMGHAPES